MEGQELAERHIALRESAGLTQEQEAKMAGVSPTTISGIESGKITRPHLKTLLKIARALGADVGELRESGKAPVPPSPEQPDFNGLLEEERRSSKTVAGEAHLSGTGKLTATGKIMQAVDEYHEGEISREELEERIEELIPA